MPPRSGSAALLAAAALAGAGCGGGGGDSPQAVAERWVTSSDPDKCRLLLPETLTRVTGRRGAGALRFCEENVRRATPPGDAKVIESEIDRRRGQALVELVADQREERVLLVRRDGEWLIADFPE